MMRGLTARGCFAIMKEECRLPSWEDTVKKLLRLPIILLLVALLLSSFVGCTTIEESEAEACVLGCLDAMVRADYAAADAYFHPLAFREADFEGCEAYAARILARHRIDLANGYTVTDRQGEHSPGLRDAAYEFSFEGTVGSARVAVTAVIFRNAEGFGIFTLTVAPIKHSVV